MMQLAINCQYPIFRDYEILAYRAKSHQSAGVRRPIGISYDL